MLGKKFGLFGIIAATLIARGLTNLWYDPYAVFKHGFGKSPLLYLKKYCHFILVLFIAAISCYYSMRVINSTRIISCILKILICSLNINIIFLVAFFRWPEFNMLKRIIANVLTIVRNKMK
mgnify:FL=1